LWVDTRGSRRGSRRMPIPPTSDPPTGLLARLSAIRLSAISRCRSVTDPTLDQGTRPEPERPVIRPLTQGLRAFRGSAGGVFHVKR